MALKAKVVKRILCPTDFSDPAAGALAYAGKIAKRMGADICLLHVKLLAELTPEEALLGVGWADEPALTAQLQEACNEISRVYKVGCYSEEVNGAVSLANEVERIASGYDLIVMGTNGEDDIAQYFLGSNTYRVIRKAVTPVLIVPEGCVYSEIQRIAYAFDYWRVNTIPMTQVVKFARDLGARLTIVQVMEDSFSQDAERDLSAQQTMIKGLYASDLQIDYETIHNSDIVEGLNGFMTRGQMDLLALCIQQRGFGKAFRSGIVRELSKIADYPVFVFPR